MFCYTSEFKNTKQLQKLFAWHIWLAHKSGTVSRSTTWSCASQNFKFKMLFPEGVREFFPRKLGPGCTSIKSCLLYQKICHHVGFASAAQLSTIFKNEWNVPNVQRYPPLKIAKLWTLPKCHKTSKKLLRCQLWREWESIWFWQMPTIQTVLSL